jgi:thiamine-monophosphate kinase
MAGIPEYALIALSGPEDFYLGNQVLSLYAGLNDCCERYKTKIVGGDITRGAIVSIAITILGRAHPAGILKRKGAQTNDVVLVTGDFGASAAGLSLLENKNVSSFEHCVNKHRRPLPRLEESHELVTRTGSRGALMDASDGLADALMQIAQASEVGMQIDLEAIPLDADTRAFAAQTKIDPYELALYGGEDYELVACLPKNIWQDWQKQAPESASSFIQIGVVNETNNIQLMFGNETAHELDLRKVFQHIA